jgi:hypothetical protein
MAIGLVQNLVSLSDILAKTTEEDILYYYFKTTVPGLISSPLREDRKPSFGFYYSNSGSIKWVDFSTRERGSLYDLLEKLWNKNFQEVLDKIYDDLPKFALSSDNQSNITKHGHNRITYSNETLLECKVREWRKYDLDYWESYGVSLPWLKFGDIYPISHIIITKDKDKSKLRYVVPAEKYAYAYVERKDDIISLKIYQPLSKTHKWSNKHDSSVWDLWTQLPEKGENLIITSSRKDALCVWENTGIPSCSLQAESYLPKEHVVNQLKERFKNIFILYDNDFKSNVNHGRILGGSMAKKFNLIQIEIPDEYKSKDTSDLCKNYNRQTVKKVILDLLNKAINYNKSI